ncbi:MAG: HypC/HybG/HupF family hydrogenase formation chaperone [Deltaproteobacteria bacterium]|nr:HypC/HybG/HupF family hydrogenase formation chaperone [Deltaproteobacteria bacterium]
MCISFPGRIIAFKEDDCLAVIEIGGTRREVSLDLLDEPVTLNDYLLCHAGFAIHKIDAEEAEKSLALLQEIIDNEIY